MSETTLSLIFAVCIFGSALLGMFVRSRLPEHHVQDDSKDAVKLGAGMIATLAALVLGLLVSSAKGSFETMSAGIVQGGAKIVLLDRVLAQYGAESGPIREQLRHNLTAGIEMFWSERQPDGSGMAAWESVKGLEQIQEKLRALSPHSDAQRTLLVQAQQIAGELLLARWLFIEQTQSTFPLSFLAILLFWLSLLYVSFGLLSPRNATVIAVLFLGAVSLATAVFLILEMSRPLDGVIKISGAPMQKALEHLGQ
ncbi:MAG TPA: hypothetical protein VI457_12280 [Methylococcaceae bacterium]|nr:hypothetical protein [Methylococcaceae bacterium]